MNYIGTEYGFCAQTSSFWQLVGYFLLVVKIVIPVALIIIGIITLGKAVISSDEKDTKKGINSLIKKFLVAAVIFFVPNIITALFSVVSNFNDVKDDYIVCNKCMSHPNSDFCKKKVYLTTEDV